MRPYYFHQGFWHHYHRPPSRLVWFLIGSFTTAFFIQKRQQICEGNSWGHCRRAPIQVPQNLPQPPLPPEQQQPAQQFPLPAQATPSPPQYPPHPIRTQPWARGQNDYDQQWEQDKERLKNLSKQAQEAMADMSEATLDAIIYTAKSLRNKLAERKEVDERTEKSQTPSQTPPLKRWI